MITEMIDAENYSIKHCRSKYIAADNELTFNVDIKRYSCIHCGDPLLQILANAHDNIIRTVYSYKHASRDGQNVSKVICSLIFENNVMICDPVKFLGC